MFSIRNSFANVVRYFPVFANLLYSYLLGNCTFLAGEALLLLQGERQIVLQKENHNNRSKSPCSAYPFRRHVGSRRLRFFGLTLYEYIRSHLLYSHYHLLKMTKLGKGDITRYSRCALYSRRCATFLQQETFQAPMMSF